MLCYLSNQIFYFLSGDGMGKISDFVKTSGEVIDKVDKGTTYLKEKYEKINSIQEGINTLQTRINQMNSGEWDEEKRKCAVWDAKAEKMKKRYMIFWVLILIATIVLLFVI